MSINTKKSSNRSIVISIIVVVFAMLALTAASVPLYRLYCQVTGYGGTVRIFKKPSEQVGNKKITVNFNAHVDPQLKWYFKPKQIALDLKTGENKLTFYEAKNLTKQDIVGMAVYNITPFIAGKYFNKVECFCFERQVLKAGEQALMPVLFFISPEIEQDPDLKDVQEITLSYTFYKLDE